MLRHCGEVTLYLCVIKVCEGVKARLHLFLNSALGVGECSALLLCYFTAGKEPPLYPLNRKFVGPRAGLEYMEQKKTLAPAGSQTKIHRFDI